MVSFGVICGFLGITNIILIAVYSVVTAIPTYFLWNWLMPLLFGIKTLTLFQAWGINFLVGILFKK